jgi:ATP-dependent exoDNAse (exonuclease V) alpha subunit
MDEFKNALHILANREMVTKVNREKLMALGTPIARMNATHIGGKTAEMAKKDDAGGLSRILHLAVGARVMLTCNLWVEQGLVNGAMGIVRAICYEEGVRPPELPLVVFVQFDKYTGPTINGCVPIVPRQAQWHDKRGMRMRRQLPLALAWAVTVHKAQGLTVEKAEINIGPDEFTGGLSYVAFSRTASLQDMVIHPFDYSRISSIHNQPRSKDRAKEEQRLRHLH